MAELIVTKRCSHCKIVKRREDFHKHSTKSDELQTKCKTCCAEYQKQYRTSENGKASRIKYRQTLAGKYANRLSVQIHQTTYPERCKARLAVTYVVHTDRLPKAATMSCTACGKPANEWHHHLGYDREHWLNVIPLCYKCHASA